MAAIAARWSITLGRPVLSATVVLCLIDLKLAAPRRTGPRRLHHRPRRLRSRAEVVTQHQQEGI